MSTKAKLKFDQRKIAAIVKRQEWNDEPLSGDPIALLVHSALLENATRQAADQALQRIRDRTVSLNEFRICLPTEASAILGARVPNAQARSITIRRMLYDVFRRNHGLHLEHLSAASKRDVRAALDNLDGATPFIAARVSLLAYGAHVMPVDDALRASLAHAGLIDATMSTDELIGQLERCFKGELLREAHLALQAWSDAHQPKPARAPKSTKSTKGTASAKATAKSATAKGSKRKAAAAK